MMIFTWVYSTKIRQRFQQANQSGFLVKYNKLLYMIAMNNNNNENLTTLPFLMETTKILK